MKCFWMAALAVVLTCAHSGHANVTPTETEHPALDLKFVEGLMLPLPKAMRKLVDYGNLVTLAQATRDLSARFAATGELSDEDADAYLEVVGLALSTTREPLMRAGDLDPELIWPTSRVSPASLESRRRAAARVREMAHTSLRWLAVGTSQVVFASSVDERVARRLSLKVAAYANTLVRNGSNATAARRSELERAVALFLMVSTKPYGVTPPKSCQEYLGRLRTARAALKKAN